jgi:AraC-like DNA-binding protein
MLTTVHKASLSQGSVVREVGLEQIDSRAAVSSRELRYSVRLLAPFLRALEKYDAFSRLARERLAALDPDERVPIATVHEGLATAVALTSDPDLGLKAAREVLPGDYGVVEYAARSCADWGEIWSVLGRYLPLVNDALSVVVREFGQRIVIVLESSVELPRAAADFQSGAFHVSARHFWSKGAAPQFEAWFKHGRPSSIEAYATTFPGAVLRFEAAFNGFVFDKSYASVPVISADPKLHELMRHYGDSLLASMPRVQSLTERVRELIVRELAGGNPNAHNVARQLPMGARTLSRRLENEGTTFKELLDDVRRRSALRYLAVSALPISEIAFLLGFSQATAFHRAFKRWTGQTPLEYRQAHRA